MAHASSPPGLSLRFYRDGDDERLLPLLEAAFDGWPAVETTVPALEHLRWKLRSRPEALGYHFVAEQDRRMVGLRAFLLQRVLIGGRSFSARQEVDTCVHPDEQHKGVMSAMVSASADGIDRAFDLSFSILSGRPAMKRLNESDDEDAFFCKISVLERALGDPPAAGHPAGWAIQGRPAFDARIDGFFEEAAQQFDCIVVRSAAELNWRYADVRAGAFTIRLAEQEGRVLGYAVLRSSQNRAHIADLLALPGRLDVAASLVRDALVHFSERGGETIECWSPADHPYRPLLRQAGFLRTRRSISMKFVPRCATRDQIAPIGRRGAVVHFMAGDSDLV